MEAMEQHWSCISRDQRPTVVAANRDWVYIFLQNSRRPRKAREEAEERDAS